MQIITYNKLVRDQIPCLIEESKRTANLERIPPHAYRSALTQKLEDKVKEYIQNDDTADLVDILELSYELATLHGLTNTQLDTMRQQKVLRCGAFHNKTFLKSVIDYR